MQMIQTFSGRPQSSSVRQPVFKKRTDVRFGVCVNKSTSREQFEKQLLLEGWAARYHALASAGGAGTDEIAKALADLIMGQGEIGRVIKDLSDPLNPRKYSNKNQKLTIISIVKMLKSPHLSDEVREKLKKSLEDAKKQKYMRDAELQELLDWAIKEANGKTPAKSRKVQDAIDNHAHEGAHAAGQHHHH